MGFSSSSSNGSIASSTDVILSNVTTGQVLGYNASLSKWQNINQSAKSYATFNVHDYGAVGDGTTDDTAAIANAAAAAVSAGKGIIYLPAGTYKVTSLPSFTPVQPSGPLTYAIRGDGSALTKIMSYASSATGSLTVSNPNFLADNASFGAPEWSGFTIDGTNSSGGASGLIWGDVSYPLFTDIAFNNFATGDGMYFNNGYGWTEGVGMFGVVCTYNLNQLRFAVGLGALIGNLGSSISSGATITSISVSGGVQRALYSGQNFVVYNGSGRQVLTTSANVSAGATSIPIVSTTADAAYTTSNSKVYVGSYGSFDYWTLNQLYLGGAPNQNGIVSEVPLGLGNTIDRVGSYFRITGNFNNGATNTGKIIWLKGEDHFDINWDLAIETDGGQSAQHISFQMDNGSAYIGGVGSFSLAGFAAPVMQGLYQYFVAGSSNVTGITSASGTFSKTLTSATQMRFIYNQPTYSHTIQSGVAYQNTDYADYWVTLPITFTGNGTVKWQVDTYSSIPAGYMTPMTGTTGQTVWVTFIHFGRQYARIDVTNATIGTAFAQII